MRRLAALSLSLFIAMLFPGVGMAGGDAQKAKLEKPSLKIVTAGTSSQIYFIIPALARQLGYFKDEGLDIEWYDAGSGAKGVQALVASGADIAIGSFEHTIHMQAKGKSLVSIVAYNESAGNAFGVTKTRAAMLKDGRIDLKGAQIGVSSPGSSTHMFATLVTRDAGLQPNDVSYIAVGTGAGAVAAFRGGKVDAMSNTDPIITELVDSGDMVLIADGRKLSNSEKYYGGPYASGCLYAMAEFIDNYPNTAQAVANAIVRVFRWLRTADVDKIISVLPPEYVEANRDLYRRSILNNIGSWSKDGLISKAAADTILLNVARFDPSIDRIKIDISKTYTNVFVERALKAYP
jgi:NitT/TauT family transport system substrate-binding protein